MTKREQMQKAIETARTLVPPTAQLIADAKEAAKKADKGMMCEMSHAAKYGSGNPSTPADIGQPIKKPKPPRPLKKPHTPDAYDNEQAAKGRLPHWSRFNVVFDEEKKQWQGFLTMPRDGNEPLEFYATHSGVFKLLVKLDDQYRQWLLTQQATAPSSPAPLPPSDSQQPPAQ